jgi:hypothetical protein
MHRSRILSSATTNLDRTIGDADGLGEIRKKELVKSGLQLGIGSKEDILVVEDKYAMQRWMAAIC